ncbi:NAD(P)/FAD-dependent oxidoreductase [Rhodococcus sp. WS4]|nr:NAD(P)/FAD-dependent oxidoreductase [Rhodococcus sp. WS4]
MTMSHVGAPDLDCEVVVVGAGFAGLYAIHALREKGFSLKAFESGTSVGGTWFWNRYPGARCDVESLAYQYSFSQELVDEWTWTERYATQPEILAYAEWVADRLDLRREITFNTRVSRAVYDEEAAYWTVETDDGSLTTARFVVAASGSISAPQVPPLEGINDFAGETYHPGRWPVEGVDFTGKRVAVIGVGSSGIQLIPEVAKYAAKLVVVQRTPAYTLPARNRPLYEDEILCARRNHVELAERARHTHSGINLPIPGDLLLETEEPKRTIMLEKNWHLGGNLFISAFPDASSDLEANEIMAEFVRHKLRTIVEDPEVARKLTPTDYPIGGKRIPTDTNYWATFNRDNVKLVSVSDEPVVRITRDGIETTETTYDVDAIIYATGYDNLTGALTRIDIRGRDGLSLQESWSGGAHTYLGLATVGFPNLFTITGPQSPSVLANMFASIEQHVEWIAETLCALRDREVLSIEATPSAEEWWADQVDEAVENTLYLHSKSWYRGTNVEGKAPKFLVYTGGLDVYRKICDDIASDNFRGFSLEGAKSAKPTQEKVTV